jgi:DNA recombination protein RmuC
MNPNTIITYLRQTIVSLQNLAQSEHAPLLALTALFLMLLFVFGVRSLMKNRALEVEPQTPDDLRSILNSWRQELQTTFKLESTSSHTILKNEMDSLLQRLHENQKLGQQRDESSLQRQIHFQHEMQQQTEKMRVMIEEQLHTNLEQKLSISFGGVADRLAKVHESLGEINNLNKSMTDFQKLMSNVKTRGLWGEVQLEQLLNQMLAPSQYEKNFKPSIASLEVVEFAIKLPGIHANEVVWLPVDAKFPVEHYLRIMEASETNNKEALLSAQKQLEAQIRQFAKSVGKKYINPPVTTDFAIIFLPSESLYAEVLRNQGLIERLQADYRVTLAGPTTFCALLSSLQMGFRSLQIQERTADVWKTLTEVKTEFNRFNLVIEAVRKKLSNSHDQMDEVARRSRVLEKKLTQLAALEEGRAEKSESEEYKAQTDLLEGAQDSATLTTEDDEVLLDRAL